MNLQNIILRNLKYLLLLIFVIFSISEVYSSNRVSSINTYQEGKNIVILYQLSEKSDISVSVSIDGGKSFKPLKSVTGDVGNDILPGYKKIVWNVLAEYEKFNFSEVCFKVESSFRNVYEFVDLGLPSGTKWATCNIGAEKPEDYGDFFAWGEIKPKTIYNWSTYKWCNGYERTLTKYCMGSYAGRVDNKCILEFIDDAAYIILGNNWDMPTRIEYEELIKNCNWIWTTRNGINGYKIVSKTNGKSIFIPASGNITDSKWFNNGGHFGSYWSKSLATTGSSFACHLYFSSSNVYLSEIERYRGLTIRPVLRK